MILWWTICTKSSVITVQNSTIIALFVELTSVHKEVPALVIDAAADNDNKDNDNDDYD